MKILKLGLKNLYKEKLYIIITLIVTIFVGAIYYYLLLTSAGSFQSLFIANELGYNLVQIITSVLNAVFSGIAIAMIVKVFRDNKNASKEGSLKTFVAILFSTAVTGCYVCGAVLLPTIGIGASLISLPFGGLEIKIFTTLILAYSIYEYARPLSGICKLDDHKFLRINNKKLVIDKEGNFFKQFNFLIVTILFIAMMLVLPLLPDSLKLDFSSEATDNGYVCESQL